MAGFVEGVADYIVVWQGMGLVFMASGSFRVRVCAKVQIVGSGHAV